MLSRPKRIPVASARVAVGIPAELLRRRPDIRSAEFKAAAESARIGVAEADLYPRFFLMGEVGVQSSNAATLFAAHSLALTAGPGFKWSILNYGQITNNVRAQDARFEEAIVDSQDTVLKAAREVEDALIGFLKAQEATASNRKSVTAAEEAVRLSFIRYREGAEDFQRVVNSERALLQQKNRLAQTRSDIATNLIALYKALGGGWEIREGRPVVSEALQAEMASRTNWGGLLPAPPPPTTPKLPLPTPAGARRSCFRPTGDERERRGRSGLAPGIATANSTTGMRRHIGRSSRSRWSCSARASVSRTSSLRPAPSCFSQARFRKCPFQSPRKTRSVLNRPQSRKPARHVGRAASRTFALSRVFQQASIGAQGGVVAERACAAR